MTSKSTTGSFNQNYRPNPAVGLLFAVLLISLFGCSTAIGTKEVGFRTAYGQINTNALLNDQYSSASKNVLHRYNLEKKFEKAPREALKFLHRKTMEDNRRDLLFALAELSYYVAEKILKADDARAYYLNTAVFSYFYLFDETRDVPSDPFDRKYRWVCDFYNIALAQSMTTKDGSLEFKNGVYQLPVGLVTLSVKRQQFPLELEQIGNLIPSDRLEVYGLSRRDRDAGIGVPFIAVERASTTYPIKRSYSGTMFLRFEGGIGEINSGALKGDMELYSAGNYTKVQVDGKHVPLESDLSAQLAYTLNQPILWDLGLKEFLTGRGPAKTGIYLAKSYRPGKIPVVFVHGTVSSPIWWAEMMNTLRADPKLRRRCNFWFYFYDSGKPIIHSALQLRETLTQKINELDPEGKDGALRNMVLIGHSQGGLLVKVTATETGNKMLRSVTGKKLDELDITPEQRDTIKQYTVFKPLPFVRRVVFISTPHRGSFLAKKWVRNLARRFVSLPSNIVEQTLSVGKALEPLDLNIDYRRLEKRTSIDGMSPNNPVLLVFADIPLATGIKGHSIIAVQCEGDPTECDDGVVKYQSAHVEYVESEVIVRSGHSCQKHPVTIEEVRRILLEHLTEVSEK